MRIITICSDGIFPVITQQAIYNGYTDNNQFCNDFEIFMRSLLKQNKVNPGNIFTSPKTPPKNRQERINELLDELSKLDYGTKEIPPE